MKKAEAISILATSVRPREAKDRARYDEAVKMAIEALKSSEQTVESAQNVQDEDLISKLSEIRSEYNCFDEDGEPQYRALSEAIRILSQLADGDTISRQAAIDACTDRFGICVKKEALEALPAVQPETHWVPCSEKLPETDDKVICQTVTKKGVVGMVIGYYFDNRWCCGMNSNVIAWQPLPELYRGGDE